MKDIWLKEQKQVDKLVRWFRTVSIMLANSQDKLWVDQKDSENYYRKACDLKRLGRKIRKLRKEIIDEGR